MSDEPCTHCNGSKQLMLRINDVSRVAYKPIVCPKCKGTGVEPKLDELKPGELKPCPRCGAPAQESPDGVLVGCSNRGYPLHCTDLQWYWRHEWQNRPIEDALRARAERAEAALKALIEWIDADDLADEICTPEYLTIKNAAREIVKTMKGGEQR